QLLHFLQEPRAGRSSRQLAIVTAPHERGNGDFIARAADELLSVPRKGTVGLPPSQIIGSGFRVVLQIAGQMGKRAVHSDDRGHATPPFQARSSTAMAVSEEATGTRF